MEKVHVVGLYEVPYLIESLQLIYNGYALSLFLFCLNKLMLVLPSFHSGRQSFSIGIRLFWNR